MVSHQMGTVRGFCDAGIVLHKGKISYYDDLEEAIARHIELNG
jgi:capsular polysaccharide transport system ATP-binding protein